MSDFRSSIWNQCSKVIVGPTFCVFGLILVCVWLRNWSIRSDKNGLPIVNRRFTLEPHIFAIVRWAFNATKILDDAKEKYGDQPYVLAKGDFDLTVLPAKYIPELNRLPANVLDSRKSHSTSLLGHLTGMDAVLESDHHVKVLHHRITPTLDELQGLVAAKVDGLISELFPRDTASWTSVQPLQKVVHCVSQGVALLVFGEPLCDDQELVELLYQHTAHVFEVSFTMRLLPWYIQRLAVWLLPAKWRLTRSWKRLERYIVPEARQRLAGKTLYSSQESSTFISHMIDDAIRGQLRLDERLLTRLVGSLAAGGTWSTAAAICGTLANLTKYPEALEEIRKEVRAIHSEVKGKWDLTALNRLDRLDSALKETLRLAPGSLLIYSRKVLADVTLSDGLHLKKGSFIAVSGRARSSDEAIFHNPSECRPLRAFEKCSEAHRRMPFRTIDGEDFRWGAGRWACPGRYIASMMAKIILVKLLHEFDLSFGDKTRPDNSVLHEFVFFHPSTEIQMRRRANDFDIEYMLSKP